MFDVSYIGTQIKLATPTGGHEIRFIYFCRGFSRDGSTKYYFTSYVFVWFVALRTKQQLHVWS